MLLDVLPASIIRMKTRISGQWGKKKALPRAEVLVRNQRLFCLNREPYLMNNKEILRYEIIYILFIYQFSSCIYFEMLSAATAFSNSIYLQDLKGALCTTKAGMQFMQMKFHEEFSNLGENSKVNCYFCILLCFQHIQGFQKYRNSKIWPSIFIFAAVHIHSLAHAASGYHRVLEENRKLYNQVQDLRGNN